MTEEERTTRGRVRWKITYKFLFNPKGWNNFPSSQDRQYYLATFGGGVDDPRIFESADFDSLFEVPLPVDYQNIGYG